MKKLAISLVFILLTFLTQNESAFSEKMPSGEICSSDPLISNGARNLRPSMPATTSVQSRVVIHSSEGGVAVSKIAQVVVGVSVIKRNNTLKLSTILSPLHL